MWNYLRQLPGETQAFILKFVMLLGAFIIIVVFFTVVKRKFKRSLNQLIKTNAQIEEHEIDTLRTSTLTRSYVHMWIKNHMKNGTCCVLMTGQAAKEKDYDISLPSADGGCVYYLCVYHPGRQKTLNRSFVVADNIEPELDSLLRDNDGSVVFKD